MYERIPLARFHPVSRWSRRRRESTGGRVMRRWRQQNGGSRLSRPFVNERTNTAIKSSSIRRGSCQNFGTLGREREGGEGPSLLPAMPGMKIAPLLSLSLPRSHSNANKYGTRKSVSLSVYEPKSRNLSDILCIHVIGNVGKVGSRPVVLHLS